MCCYVSLQLERKSPCDQQMSELSQTRRHTARFVAASAGDRRRKQRPNMQGLETEACLGVSLSFQQSHILTCVCSEAWL